MACSLQNYFTAMCTAQSWPAEGAVALLVGCKRDYYFSVLTGCVLTIKNQCYFASIKYDIVLFNGVVQYNLLV